MRTVPPRVALDVLFSSLQRAQGQTAQGQVAVCAVLPLRSLKRTMLVTGRVGGLGGVGRTHRRVMPQRGDGLPQGPAEPARWRDTRVVERALQLVCHVLRVERSRQRLRPPWRARTATDRLLIWVLSRGGRAAEQKDVVPRGVSAQRRGHVLFEVVSGPTAPSFPPVVPGGQEISLGKSVSKPPP